MHSPMLCVWALLVVALLVVLVVLQLMQPSVPAPLEVFYEF